MKHAGEHDEDNMVYVKVSGSTDRWARSGWCFEALVDEHGRREPVLERVNPPKREVRAAKAKCNLLTRNALSR